jgi:hypothetical protein
MNIHVLPEEGRKVKKKERKNKVCRGRRVNFSFFSVIKGKEKPTVVDNFVCPTQPS